MRKILTFLLLLVCTIVVQAQSFDEFFTDRTLRLDYVFSGDNHHQDITLDELSQSPNWYGRRHHLDSLLLQGNGQICVQTMEGSVVYRHSFSTLFQEWQGTAEAAKTRKSFENVFLVPFPKDTVDITVTLTDNHNRETARFTHRVDPKDILIRHIGETGVTPWEYVYQGGDPKTAIDVAIVAEGYTSDEMQLFLEDCEMAVKAYQDHEPFKSLKEHFNFVAVCSPSAKSGISIPHKGLWVNTVLGSNYDTFYSERYLTTLHLKKLHDVLAGIPYEHIIILANTENYGGGGIYNSYMMSSAHHVTARPVIVHEFGHSFAGLADEYFYDDEYEPMYPSDTEPWEPNITTLVDFGRKWQDMLPKGLSIPTSPEYATTADKPAKQGSKKAKKKANQTAAANSQTAAIGNNPVYTKLGVYEGGGYQSKGVYRPTVDCRMKTNEAPVFCPVCDRAIRRLVEFYTK